MNLRQWLFEHRLSIKEFSSLIGIDRTYAHKLMKGDRKPSEEIMEKIRYLTVKKVLTVEDLKDKDIPKTIFRDVKKRKRTAKASL